MAEDIIETMDEAGITQADLIGHSMGGKLAMEIALSYHERVRRLVVEDAVPGKTPPRARHYLEMLREIDLSKIHTRRSAEESLNNIISDRSMLLFLLKNLDRDGEGNYSWKANLDALHTHYDRISEGLQENRIFSGPVLFIAGERSDVVNIESMQEIRTMFPDFRIERIEGAGHWVHADAPEIFLSLLGDFLDEGQQLDG